MLSSSDSSSRLDLDDLKENLHSVKTWLSTTTISSAGHWKGIHWESWTGDAVEVAARIKRGETTTAHVKNGWTPLHLAVWNKHKNVVKVLLESSARQPWDLWRPQRPKSIDLENQDGWRALHLAAWNNDVGMIELLMHAGQTFRFATITDWIQHTGLHQMGVPRQSRL